MIPKFRAWLKKEKKLCDVSILDMTNKMVWVFLPKKDFLTAAKKKIDDVVLMQSTTPFDQNGTEIYEGDICSDEGEFGYDGWVYGFVKWDKEDLRWVVEWPTEDLQEPLGGYSYHFGYGNIYENPELLEV